MALKRVPDLTEVAANMAGSMTFVLEQVDLIRERVKNKRKPSNEDLFDVLHLIKVMADVQSTTADAIQSYDHYLKKVHGLDTSLIVAIEE
jgi:hypothetical protein